MGTFETRGVSEQLQQIVRPSLPSCLGRLWPFLKKLSKPRPEHFAVLQSATRVKIVSTPLYPAHPGLSTPTGGGGDASSHHGTSTTNPIHPKGAYHAMCSRDSAQLVMKAMITIPPEQSDQVGGENERQDNEKFVEREIRARRSLVTAN